MIEQSLLELKPLADTCERILDLVGVDYE